MIILNFVLFLLIFSSIYLGIHYYIYLRIVKGLQIARAGAAFLKWMVLLGALLFIGSKLLSAQYPLYWLSYIGGLWMGFVSITFSVFIVKDLAGLILKWNPKLSTIIALVIALALTGYSAYNESRGPVIKVMDIPLHNLPQELDGFSIVQLSDIHLGILTKKEWLGNVVDKTNELAPDLIAFTGDLIDENPDKLGRFLEILNRLNAKHGVFIVAGNHEFYPGINKFERFLRQTDFVLLRNRSVEVAGGLIIAGIDDATAQRMTDTVPDIGIALSGITPNAPIILLSHQPDVFDDALNYGVDLQLSGHTHAGQIPPMDLAVLMYFKYPYGLYSSGNAYIYTSAGTGTWGPPMRLFSRSEIVKFVLKTR